MAGADHTDILSERVREAYESSTPLRIRGGDTKAFFGRGEARGEEIRTDGHRGIVSYEPTELVLTARAGTPLHEIEARLQEHNQMLPFEPPHFGAGATLGGTVACGLSGPRRPYAGAVRDAVLGVRCINGRGEVLRFGGQVMKNVAGFDVSRLMCGALGTLGVLLEVSLRLVPRPAREVTVVREEPSPARAIEHMRSWAQRPLPISATAWVNGLLYIRLSGTERAVSAAVAEIGGEPGRGAGTFWRELREHTHSAFDPDRPLWRISVAPGTPPLPGDAARAVIEWGGALRWWSTDADPESVRAMARDHGGHAQLFRGGDRTAEVFHPLSDALLRIHQRLKHAFDPHGVLNPGRLYADL